MRTIAIAASALLLGAAGASATVPRPVLKLVARAPVTVHGEHFKARERVTVTVTTLSVHAKSAVATRTGTFTVSFPAVFVGRCGPFSIRAVGSRRSVALLKLPLPACMAE